MLSPAFGLEATYSEVQPQEMAAYKGGPMAKADYALTRAHDEFKSHRRYWPERPFQPSNPLIRAAEGRVLVEAVASTDPIGLLNDLRGLGLTKGSRYGSRISGWLPFGLLTKAISLDNLQSISASLAPITHTGLVSSEGDTAMRADVARLTYGMDGSGTKVGVISDSYDALHDAAKDQANDDLPPAEQVTVMADYASGSDEGRAIMQIIHDVAPAAALSFHTAFNGMADFAGGIVELAQEGAGIIVDDVLYFAEPMFQDGIVAQAVDQVVND
ncbi:MAG TPA: hypothetical protein VLA15_10305, partial [Desulfurivibrionaceae bacterium]|nr:hypothetical protein [Desulfurivibrionaceae bacterium]